MGVRAIGGMGHQFKALRVVNVDEASSEQLLDDVIYESQRLMAFLDETDRAYGSPEALASLLTAKVRGGSAKDGFLETWRKATLLSADDDSLAEIFTYRAIKRDEGGLSACSSWAVQHSKCQG